MRVCRVCGDDLPTRWPANRCDACADAARAGDEHDAARTEVARSHAETAERMNDDHDQDVVLADRYYAMHDQEDW